jgi:hypothetical protein
MGAVAAAVVRREARVSMALLEAEESALVVPIELVVAGQTNH